ncbi:MAG: hypothetical protein LBG58_04280 [Planctomycetaceae bacterium]|nr:hypothetical protein [Planctomycetaceae bacterium]
MLRQWFIVVLIVLPFILNIGCSKHPKGFPKLYPCSIALTKNGKPLHNVCVLLKNETVQGTWGISGTTDISGTAIIVTSLGEYIGKGIPNGEYIVSLDEIIHPPNGKTKEEIGKLPEEELYKYIAEEAKMIDALRIIPKEFSDSNKSPLKIAVKANSNNKIIINLDDYTKP